jgi:haloacetate dehalogenase
MLCLWSFNDDLEQIYGYQIAIWKHRVDNVRGYGIGSRHHVAEGDPALSQPRSRSCLEA